MLGLIYKRRVTHADFQLKTESFSSFFNVAALENFVLSQIMSYFVEQ